MAKWSASEKTLMEVRLPVRQSDGLVRGEPDLADMLPACPMTLNVLIDE